MVEEDYNDGEWHVWDGNWYAPVHPKTLVEAVWHDEVDNKTGITGPRVAVADTGPILAWGNVVKFRVVKAYQEPREYFIDPVHNMVFTPREVDKKNMPSYYVHVREVVDE